MLNIEKLFNSAFCAIRSHPQIMLPFMLNWLPTALISISATLIRKDIVDSYTFSTLIELFETAPVVTMMSIISAHAELIIFIVAVYTVSVIIGAYINTLYPRISWQIYHKQSISIKDAVETANNRYGKVLWTSILFDTLIILGIGISFITLMIIFALAAIGGISMASLAIGASIFGFFAFILFIVYVIPANILLSPVVVFENQSGIAAIRKSFQTLKGRIGHIWLYIIFLIVANGIYFSFASALISIMDGIIGTYTTILTTVITLFPSTFILLAYGLLYLELTSQEKEEHKDDSFINC